MLNKKVQSDGYETCADTKFNYTLNLNGVSAKLFIYFCDVGLRPYQEYFVHIESIVKQRWTKIAAPEEKRLTTKRSQNMAFSLVYRATPEPTAERDLRCWSLGS